MSCLRLATDGGIYIARQVPPHPDGDHFERGRLDLYILHRSNLSTMLLLFLLCCLLSNWYVTVVREVIL